MTDSYMAEYPYGTPANYGDHSGPITVVERKAGDLITAQWYDNRNKSNRSIKIEIDLPAAGQMTITESGDGGPTQKWIGPYKEQGSVYKMNDGTLVEENNVAVQNRWMIWATIIVP